MDTKPTNVVMLTQQGRPTDPAVKEDAFRLWIAYARSWKRVNEQTGIPISTLHSWADNDGWEEKRRDQANSFLPGMHVETAINLRMAGHYASMRLQQVMYEAAEQGKDPDSKVVQALSLAIDRAGHSPVGRKDPEALMPHATARQSMGALTDDELHERESSIGAGRQG